MAKDYAKLQGLEIMNGDLRKVIDNMGKAKIKDILISSGGLVADEMEMRAPKNTGNLANSIRIFDDPKYKYSVMIAPDYDRIDQSQITSPALLSIIEYGANEAIAGKISSKSKGHRKTNEQGYWRVNINGTWVTMDSRAPLKPNPFIRPAYDAVKVKVVEKMKRDIKAAIKEEAKKTKTLG